MFQLIAFIIFIISCGGILAILYSKIHILAELPQNGHHGLKKPETLKRIEKKLKETHFHFFQKQMLLHRFLSKSRVWLLKTERRIDSVLHGIRKKAQELDNQIKKKKW
jgi:hypothetical protein